MDKKFWKRLLNALIKNKIIITACTLIIILLLLVLFIFSSGNSSSKKDDDASLLNSKIVDYANSIASMDDANKSGLFGSDEGSSFDDKNNLVTPDSFTGSSDESVLIKGDLDSESNKNRNDVSGNSLYDAEGTVLKSKLYKNVKFDSSSQLKELLDYWNQNNLDAVKELVHTERFEAMSASVTSQSSFLYYGAENTDGEPEGVGLAVYSNDRYYFGEWKAGKRSGEGTWFQFYPEYDTGTVDEHMYSGSFLDDLPDGQGQENYTYDLSKMDGVSFYAQNVIGTFSKGYYNGDMYVITQSSDSSVTEWYGTCLNGIWKAITSKDSKGNSPVLYQSQNKDHYIWMSDDANKNYGVNNI